jgi:hypothetical protein
MPSKTALRALRILTLTAVIATLLLAPRLARAGDNPDALTDSGKRTLVVVGGAAAFGVGYGFAYGVSTKGSSDGDPHGNPQIERLRVPLVGPLLWLGNELGAMSADCHRSLCDDSVLGHVIVGGYVVALTSYVVIDTVLQVGGLTTVVIGPFVPMGKHPRRTVEISPRIGFGTVGLLGAF